MCLVCWSACVSVVCLEMRRRETAAAMVIVVIVIIILVRACMRMCACVCVVWVCVRGCTSLFLKSAGNFAQTRCYLQTKKEEKKKE